MLLGFQRLVVNAIHSENCANESSHVQTVLTSASAAAAAAAAAASLADSASQAAGKEEPSPPTSVC